MGPIQYSEKYFDDQFEYRHVVLPNEVAKLVPKGRLLSEPGASSCLILPVSDQTEPQDAKTGVVWR